MALDGQAPPERSDLTLSEADRRWLVPWACECVERLLPIFHAVAPHDPRLIDALDAAKAFARGDLGVGAVRTFAFACHAAAREVDGDAPPAVARACGQAVSIAHMAGHSREIAGYTRKALGAAAAVEVSQQRARLPARFVDYVYAD